MIAVKSCFASALLFAVASLSNGASAAVITQLADPTGLNLSNNFEATVNNADVTFDANSYLISAFVRASSGTPSGLQGIGLDANDEPLTGVFSSARSAVGIWFGNDDFSLVFDVLLEAYSGASLIGSVMVTSNANDFADQFIGLSSDMAFDSFRLSYARPAALGLALYADDLYLGNPAVAVPEPGSVALLGLGLACLAWTRRKMAA